MKKSLLLFSTAAALMATSVESSAQTVIYDKFTTPIYRRASNQRFSNYKNIYYRVQVDSNTIFSMVDKKFLGDQASRNNVLKVFNESMQEELKKSSLNPATDAQPDLIVDCNLTGFSSKESINSATGLNTGAAFKKDYEVEGAYRTTVRNMSGKVYYDKSITLSSKRAIPDGEKVTGAFNAFIIGSPSFYTGTAYSNYRVLMNVIKEKITDHQEEVVNRYVEKTISLPYIYRASKKYPELTVIDSMNNALVKELKLKNATDYAQLIQPYEAAYLQLLQKSFPENYERRPINAATYCSLVFLYYLSYDKDKMQTALDSLYNYSSKALGMRGDYNAAKLFKDELEAYFASVNVPKYRVGEREGEQAQVTQTVTNTTTTSTSTPQATTTVSLAAVRPAVQGSWIELSNGDTIRGRYVPMKGMGSVISFNMSTVLTFESNGEAKNYKLSEVKSFAKNGRLYVVYKYKKPTGPGKKELAFEVLYSSDKIKVVKENFEEHPSNQVLFIRPGEADLLNPDKGFVSDRSKTLRQYMQDSPAVLKKLDEKVYDFEKEESLVQVAIDYTNSK
ncbi:hypothetical protein [Chitinophaga dinghuensis]|nr:hypothetical protein [Chitinophaga dinghuensis]